MVPQFDDQRTVIRCAARGADAVRARRSFSYTAAATRDRSRGCRCWTRCFHIRSRCVRSKEVCAFGIPARPRCSRSPHRPATMLPQRSATAAGAQCWRVFSPPLTRTAHLSAETYAWVAALNDLGEVDRTVAADAPFAAVFTRTGKRTHVAWNLSDKPRTVVFSDAVKVECPAHGPAWR